MDEIRIRKEKVANSKISGYVWTETKSRDQKSSRMSEECVKSVHFTTLKNAFLTSVPLHLLLPAPLSEVARVFWP